MPSVLIVDDCEEIRVSLRCAFEQSGYVVREASDGGDGVDAMRRQPADLVVVDIFMPRVCGLELISAVRREFPTVPIFAMSGGAGSRGDISLLPVAKRIGAAKVFTKPFDPEVVVLAAGEELEEQKSIPFGKYRLLRRLGAGSMGAVYKAEHIELGRTVAIKIMNRKLLDTKHGLERFLREIQVAAALNHPNIVTVYDADCHNHRHYLVMEYVEGRDLEDWVTSDGALSIELACEIVRQAALGLSHAHQRGVIHRDIKPSNLLVSANPEGGYQVKILDMGLARFVEEVEGALPLTRDDQLLGTPDYMAPEQATVGAKVDSRADLFSLGCTFYRLLTGVTPFLGATPLAKVLARTKEDAPLLRERLPEAPSRLESLLAKMLARNPNHRPASAADIAKSLSRLTARQIRSAVA